MRIQYRNPNKTPDTRPYLVAETDKFTSASNCITGNSKPLLYPISCLRAAQTDCYSSRTQTIFSFKANHPFVRIVSETMRLIIVGVLVVASILTTKKLIQSNWQKAPRDVQLINVDVIRCSADRGAPHEMKLSYTAANVTNSVSASCITHLISNNTGETRCHLHCVIYNQLI